MRKFFASSYFVLGTLIAIALIIFLLIFVINNRSTKTSTGKINTSSLVPSYSIQINNNDSFNNLLERRMIFSQGVPNEKNILQSVDRVSIELVPSEQPMVKSVIDNNKIFASGFYEVNNGELSLKVHIIPEYLNHSDINVTNYILNRKLLELLVASTPGVTDSRLDQGNSNTFTYINNLEKEIFGDNLDPTKRPILILQN